MIQEKQRIAITSIGSGVGQSIVDSLHLSNIKTELFGYGYTPFAFGAYDCSYRRIVPSIYSPSYIETLLQYCIEDKINILLPGLDDELFILAKNIQKFTEANIYIPISSLEVLELCRDKEKMTNELSIISDCFVASYNKKNLLEKSKKNELTYPLIAKPKSGFASRGIFILLSQKDIAKVDDSHVIQTIALPQNHSPHAQEFFTALEKGRIEQIGEISAQVLIGKSGEELGRMATYNNLHSGVPIQIVPVDVPEIWEAIDGFLPYLIAKGARGPINIQGRMTNNGPKFFELNARFTGITGLRAMMGFNEVERIIIDCIDHQATSPYPLLSFNKKKIGIRQVKNRVIDINYDLDLNKKSNIIKQYNHTSESGRHILITGANGYLGRVTINRLISDERVEKITALVRNSQNFIKPKNLEFLHKLEVLEMESLYNGKLSFGTLDSVIHLASARPASTNADIADSLRFTSELTSLASRFNLPFFINASSQAVYGTSRLPLWDEGMSPMPETLYAQTKWASELMTKNIKSISPVTQAVSLRFSQLMGGNYEATNYNQILHRFISSAFNGENLLILGGEQTLDMLDVEDAASIICSLTLNHFSNLPDAINIGSGHPISVNHLAEIVCEVFNEQLNISPKISLNSHHQAPSFGMDISIANQSIGWHPLKSIKDSTKDILSNIIKIKK